MSLPSTNLTLISKKLIVSFEYSAVNFIVGWKVFNLLRNLCRDSSPCSQIKKMSSTYLHHIIGFSSKAFRIFFSKSAINKIAYEGANFVPIAVPRTCLEVFWSNSKVVFSTISASSMRVSLEIYLLSLNSTNLRRDLQVRDLFNWPLHWCMWWNVDWVFLIKFSTFIIFLFYLYIGNVFVFILYHFSFSVESTLCPFYFFSLIWLYKVITLFISLSVRRFVKIEICLNLKCLVVELIFVDICW